MADERAEAPNAPAPNAPAPARPVPRPDWLAIALLVFFLALIGLVAALLVLPAIQG